MQAKMNVFPKLRLRRSHHTGNINGIKLLAPLFHNKRSVPVIYRLFSSEKFVNVQNNQQKGEAYMAESIIIQTDVTNDQQHQIDILSRDLEIMSKEKRILKKANDDLLNKYRRVLEDGESMRIRFHKQIVEAKLFGIQHICKDLIEIADVLGSASDSVPQNQLNDENLHLKNLYNALIMTQMSLFQIFKRHGLEPMNPLKEKYDAKIHEAVYEEKNSSVAPGTIIEVAKLGYKLHNRVIRPALVGVSK